MSTPVFAPKSIEVQILPHKDVWEQIQWDIKIARIA